MDQPSLKALAISPGRRQYTVYVSHSTAEVALTAEAGDPDVVLQVNGMPVASGQPSGPVPLQVGRNGLFVEPGGYEVKVIRAHPTPTWVRVQERCYQARADFNQGGPLRYRLVKGPEWLRVDEGSGLVWGTPVEVGEVMVEIE